MSEETKYYLDFFIENVGWNESSACFYSEKNVLEEFEKIVKESNMKWRIRKSEIVSSIIKESEDGK